MLNDNFKTYIMKKSELIKNYKFKLDNINKVIESVLVEVKIIERGGDSAMTMDEWLKVVDRSKMSKNNYTQFLNDLDELVD